MSKLLLCVVSILVVLQAVLTGEHRLAVAAQIGDEFLHPDPIRGRGSGLMLSHVHDELISSSVAAPAFAREKDAVIDGEEFSIDEYAGDEENEEVGDGQHTPEPDRSVDEEEVVEGEDDSLLSPQEGDIESSSNPEEHGSSGGGDVECPECGKHFRSNKSMFGHLRSHPGRGYKGATPPPMKPKRRATPSQSPSVHDHDRPVARYSQRDPNLNAFEMLVAYIMLTLKHRDSRIVHDQSVKVKREPADVPPEEEGSVMSRAGDSAALGDKNDISAAEMALADAELRSGDSSSAAEMARDDQQVLRSEQVVIETPAKRVSMKRSKEAHRKEKDVRSEGKSRRPYICKHCQAVFPTHQALGGHMAAHNKDRRVQAQNEQAAVAAVEAHHLVSLNRQGSEEQRGQGGLAASTRELLMERYTRMFNQGWQTRQETGGYRRQHTEREDGNTLPPVTDGDQLRLFGIDLNVQAPQQE
nr:zinc finger protein ZAT4-like [Lolium perenne]